tara:strand:+ start:80 stop:298 length:219 start_codon:yes stop_codon:yes gene_type:complete
MSGSSTILFIIVILNVILFFKIWQATNDVAAIKNHLLGEPIKKQTEVSPKAVLIILITLFLVVPLIIVLALR